MSNGEWVANRWRAKISLRIGNTTSILILTLTLTNLTLTLTLTLTNLINLTLTPTWQFALPLIEDAVGTHLPFPPLPQIQEDRDDERDSNIRLDVCVRMLRVRVCVSA